MMFVNRTVYLAFFMKITLNVLVGSSSAHSATSYGTSRGYHALNKCVNELINAAFVCIDAFSLKPNGRHSF